MIKLILFDIDGTLVLTGGAGLRAMARAFKEVFGISGDFDRVPMNGRTDSWIVAQAAAFHGIECDDSALRRFHDAYVCHLETEVGRMNPAPHAEL